MFVSYCAYLDADNGADKECPHWKEDLLDSTHQLNIYLEGQRLNTFQPSPTQTSSLNCRIGRVEYYSSLNTVFSTKQDAMECGLYFTAYTLGQYFANLWPPSRSYVRVQAELGKFSESSSFDEIPDSHTISKGLRFVAWSGAITEAKSPS